MKSFFKSIAATVFGNLLTLGLLFLFMFISLIGTLITSSSETVVNDNSVLVIKLSGNITEQSDDNPFAALLGDENNSTGLNDILAAIDKAKDNDDIKGIYLECGSLSTDYATLQEIRAKLAEYKADKKKWVVAYADSYMQSTYYLASIADKVFLNPMGSIDWHGIAAQPMYYKDFLEKFGVKFTIVKVGTFKSATESFSEDHMSDANREQTSVYINGIWDNIVKAVSKSRGISIDKLNEYADGIMALSQAAAFKQNKMVDDIMYADQAKQWVKSRLGIGDDDIINQLTVSDMTSLQGTGRHSNDGDQIAVYYCSGDIVDSATQGITSGGNAQIVGSTVCTDLEKMMKDDNIKAVVLRINSGGGSANASEQMWHYITELKKHKPVVVSMGGMAASGGYYMSCNASYIVAEPTTLTGSIGIFGMFPDASGLITQKLGIHFDEVKTHKHSSFSPLAMKASLTADEINYLQMYVNNGYSLFRKRVADGRKLKVEDVEKIAQGRVWLGQDALRLKLVDQLGTLDDAIRKAAQLAKADSYHTVDYPEPANFAAQLLQRANGGSGTILDEQLRLTLGSLYEPFVMVRNINSQSPIQARIPYIINNK